MVNFHSPFSSSYSHSSTFFYYSSFFFLSLFNHHIFLPICVHFTPLSHPLFLTLLITSSSFSFPSFFCFTFPYLCLHFCSWLPPSPCLHSPSPPLFRLVHLSTTWPQTCSTTWFSCRRFSWRRSTRSFRRSQVNEETHSIKMFFFSLSHSLNSNPEDGRSFFTVQWVHMCD